MAEHKSGSSVQCWRAPRSVPSGPRQRACPRRPRLRRRRRYAATHSPRSHHRRRAARVGGTLQWMLRPASLAARCVLRTPSGWARWSAGSPAGSGSWGRATDATWSLPSSLAAGLGPHPGSCSVSGRSPVRRRSRAMCTTGRSPLWGAAGPVEKVPAGI